MDEMNGLERQLAGVVQGAMRPPRPVDAEAIVRSATSEAPVSRWSVVTRLRGRASQASTADIGRDGRYVRGRTNMVTSLRSAAIVAVLALATSLVAVQVYSPADTVTPGADGCGGHPVTVTGTQEIVDSGPGLVFTASNVMSEERLSGDVDIDWSAASLYGADENNDALFGSITITNDGGVWHGQWVGFVDDEARHHFMVWYEGAGDYEGLRYIEQLVQREKGGLLDATGLIYEGRAPGTVVPAEVAE